MNRRTTRASPEPFESSSLSSSPVHSEEDISIRHRSPSGSHRQILHQIDFLHSLLNTFLPFSSGQRADVGLDSQPATDHPFMRAPPSGNAASTLPLESYFPPRQGLYHSHPLGGGGGGGGGSGGGSGNGSESGTAAIQDLSTARSSGFEAYINHQAQSYRSQVQAAGATMARRNRSTHQAAAPPSSFSLSSSAHAQLPGSRSSSRSVSTFSPASTATATHGGRTKTVYVLNCVYCDHFVCHRGMRAILLADVKIELFSTDCPPSK